MRHCPVHRRCNIQTRAQRKAEFGYSTVDFRPFINAVTSPHTSPELTAANSSHRLHVVSTLETLPSGNIYLMIVRMYVRSIYISHFADGFTCKTASDDKTNIPLPLYEMLPITENVTRYQFYHGDFTT